MLQVRTRLSRRARFALLWLIVAAVTLSTACRPRAGGNCIPGHAVCVDGKAGLFCGSDGSYAMITCIGSDGCKQVGDTVSCDQSIAAVDDACVGPGFACSPDRKSALTCHEGHFIPAEMCKGRRACKVSFGELGEVACDNDVADPGDPCRISGDKACTSDKTAAVECTGGRMVAIAMCRGSKGCRVRHPTQDKTDVDCDTSVAAENDPCLLGGKEACTRDGRAKLTCRGGKYSLPTACCGPHGCAVTARAETSEVTCDTAECDGLEAGVDR